MKKLDKFKAKNTINPQQASHLLFTWLCYDSEHADLYRCLLAHKTVLCFQSRAGTQENMWDITPSAYHHQVYLITA